MMEMGLLKASRVMLMAIFVGVILLASFEAATAATPLKFGQCIDLYVSDLFVHILFLY